MPNQLQFLPVSQWCTKSVCGHYTVTKTGPDFYRAYHSWFIAEPNNKFAASKPIASFLVAGDVSEADARRFAKEACQKHADKQDEVEK